MVGIQSHRLTRNEPVVTSQCRLIRTAKESRCSRKDLDQQDLFSCRQLSYRRQMFNNESSSPGITEVCRPAMADPSPSAMPTSRKTINGGRAGLSASRTGSGFAVSILTVFAEVSIPTLVVEGKLATDTAGVPLIPTFHVPLC